jgi:Raf kinase inhibitor-like YbhB/YbcL family protein
MMKLKSSAFEEGKKIPMKYTCDGENVNPSLEISGVPENAKSLALIMDDPDVPEWVRKERLYVHWIVIDMPPTTRHLAENSLPPGTVGQNTSGNSDYRGPCPPDREHRYFFKLYALDKILHLGETATKDQVEKAMANHILAQAELMGRYERKS